MTRGKLWLLLLVLAVCIVRYHGYKILLLTVPISKGSKSQLNLMVHLGETLANRGHNVTIVVQGDQKIKSSLLTQDRCPSAVNKTYSKWFTEELRRVAPNILRGQALNRDNVRMSGNVFLQECHKQLKYKELMRKHQAVGFDLAIIDHVHICGYLYARKLGVKYVTLECSSYMTLLADSLTPSPLSYVPVFTSRLTDRMTFIERTKNFFMSIFMKHFIIAIITSPYDEINDKYKIAPDMAVQELRMKSELWLINSDIMFEFPRPLMPNTVMVGGMLLKPPEPLEQELEHFVLGAGDAGVIVVCFGSALDMSYMPDLVKMFMLALGDLPQRIIWGSKFIPKDLPPNFKVLPWIPQQDLLGHPSVRCFITHGGINSLFEALYHSVPTFVIPSTADAFDNVLRLERKGTLLWKQYTELTYEKLRSEVIALINDKKYKTKAQWLSSIFQDQPLKPDKRAAFWVEHVIRNGGGRHLRSSAFDLDGYQYYMLDVIAFTMTVTLCAMLTLCCSCRFCFHKFKLLFPAAKQPTRPEEDEGEEEEVQDNKQNESKNKTKTLNDHFFQPLDPNYMKNAPSYHGLHSHGGHSHGGHSHAGHSHGSHSHSGHSHGVHYRGKHGHYE